MTSKAKATKEKTGTLSKWKLCAYVMILRRQWKYNLQGGIKYLQLLVW